MSNTLCRHCLTARAAYGRKGLCWRCSLVPEIRLRYRSLSKYGHRGEGLGMDGQSCLACPAPAQSLGLCRACHADLPTRRRYAGWKRAMHVYPDAPVPAAATVAEPGSEAKLLVLEARAQAGEALHHPQDRRWDVLGWRTAREECA